MQTTHSYALKTNEQKQKDKGFSSRDVTLEVVLCPAHACAHTNTSSQTRTHAHTYTKMIARNTHFKHSLHYPT